MSETKREYYIQSLEEILESELIKITHEAYFTEGAIKELLELLKEEPERKKGEWLELTNTNHTYVCSVCGRMLVNITDGKNTVTKNYPFCHCGADMRGE